MLVYYHAYSELLDTYNLFAYCSHILTRNTDLCDILRFISLSLHDLTLLFKFKGYVVNN